jgi:ADP-ribosyl-[dinitrogen reductase] hydrolase
MSEQNVRALWNAQSAKVAYTTEGITTADRIKGAIMGALIGDALGVGCHWYTEYESFWNDFSTWVDDYVDPVKEGAAQKWPDIHALRYKNGVRAGWNSQTGQIIQILLEVIATNVKKNSPETKGEFVASEFAEAMESFFEHQLIPTATIDKNGEIGGLSGRFTNSEIRDNFNVWYNKGAKNGAWWSDDQIASTCNTSDGSQIGVILAALYRDPWDLIPKAFEFARMIYSDPAYIQSHVMYILTVQALINGVPLETLVGYFQAINYQKADGYAENKYIPYDEMHTPHNAVNMLKKPHLFPFPDDRFVTLMFGGLDSHVKHLQPAAYYFSYKYCNDFEKAILTAVNSIGNNMACATMVGGLTGAMTGISGIPKKFIDGLANDKSLIPGGFPSQSEYLLDLAQTIADGTKGEIPDYSFTAQVLVE